MQWVKRLLDFCRRESIPQLPYQEEIDLVERLVVTSEVYRDTTYVECVETNMVVFCQLLSQALHALHGDVLFPLRLYELKQIKRCHFWRNNNGGFIDVEHYLAVYKDLNTRIWLRLREIEEQKIDDPKITTNIYRLRTVLISMKGLLLQL